nr:MAG TPA_asm: hypothetical protein [Caudoviricetes sp.]
MRSVLIKHSKILISKQVKKRSGIICKSQYNNELN